MEARTITVQVGPDRVVQIIDPIMRGAAVDFKVTANTLAAQLIQANAAMAKQTSQAFAATQEVEVCHNIIDEWTLLFQSIRNHWSFFLLPCYLQEAVKSRGGHS